MPSRQYSKRVRSRPREFNDHSSSAGYTTIYTGSTTARGAISEITVQVDLPVVPAVLALPPRPALSNPALLTPPTPPTPPNPPPNPPPPPPKYARDARRERASSNRVNASTQAYSNHSLDTPRSWDLDVYRRTLPNDSLVNLMPESDISLPRRTSRHRPRQHSSHHRYEDDTCYTLAGGRGLNESSRLRYHQLDRYYSDTDSSESASPEVGASASAGSELTRYGSATPRGSRRKFTTTPLINRATISVDDVYDSKKEEAVDWDAPEHGSFSLDAYFVGSKQTIHPVSEGTPEQSSFSSYLLSFSKQQQLQKEMEILKHQREQSFERQRKKSKQSWKSEKYNLVQHTHKLKSEQNLKEKNLQSRSESHQKRKLEDLKQQQQQQQHQIEQQQRHDHNQQQQHQQQLELQSHQKLQIYHKQKLQRQQQQNLQEQQQIIKEQQKLHKEKQEQQKLHKEKQEQQKLHKEKQQQQKLHKEKQEQQKLHKEKQEQQKLHKEKQEQQKLHKEKQEQQKLHKEKQEQQKLHKEKQEQQKLHKEKQEQQKLHKEKQQQQNLHKEKQQQQNLQEQQQIIKDQQKLHKEKKEQQKLHKGKQHKPKQYIKKKQKQHAQTEVVKVFLPCRVVDPKTDYDFSEPSKCRQLSEMISTRPNRSASFETIFENLTKRERLDRELFRLRSVVNNRMDFYERAPSIDRGMVCSGVDHLAGGEKKNGSAKSKLYAVSEKYTKPSDANCFRWNDDPAAHSASLVPTNSDLLRCQLSPIVFTNRADKYVPYSTDADDNARFGITSREVSLQSVDAQRSPSEAWVPVATGAFVRTLSPQLSIRLCRGSSGDCRKVVYRHSTEPTNCTSPLESKYTSATKSYLPYSSGRSIHPRKRSSYTSPLVDGKQCSHTPGSTYKAPSTCPDPSRYEKQSQYIIGSPHRSPSPGKVIFPCGDPSPCRNLYPCRSPSRSKDLCPCRDPSSCRNPSPCRHLSPCRVPSSCRNPSPSRELSPCRDPSPCRNLYPCRSPSTSKDLFPCRDPIPCKNPSPSRELSPCRDPSPCTNPYPCRCPSPSKSLFPCRNPSSCRNPSPYRHVSPCRVPTPCKNPSPSRELSSCRDSSPCRNPYSCRSPSPSKGLFPCRNPSSCRNPSPSRELSPCRDPFQYKDTAPCRSSLVSRAPSPNKVSFKRQDPSSKVVEAWKSSSKYDIISSRKIYSPLVTRHRFISPCPSSHSSSSSSVSTSSNLSTVSCPTLCICQPKLGTSENRRCVRRRLRSGLMLKARRPQRVRNKYVNGSTNGLQSRLKSNLVSAGSRTRRSPRTRSTRTRSSRHRSSRTRSSRTRSSRTRSTVFPSPVLPVGTSISGRTPTLRCCSSRDKPQLVCRNAFVHSRVCDNQLRKTRRKQMPTRNTKDSPYWLHPKYLPIRLLTISCVYLHI